MQEQHDLADDLLFGPAGGDPRGPHRADALDLAQPIGISLDELEDGLTEAFHQTLRVGRADAADHAGAEIALDPIERRRRSRLEKGRSELQAVGPVVRPGAGGLNPLAGRDHGGVADHGDESHCPRAFSRSTQNPFSSLWKVTRSTRPARFSVRVAGDSMVGKGLFNGDLAIVDRSLVPQSGDLVVVDVDGERSFKVWEGHGPRVVLAFANPRYPAFQLAADALVEVWGVVSGSINPRRRQNLERRRECGSSWPRRGQG